MIFKVTSKVKGEIVIPSVKLPLLANSIIKLTSKQYCSADVQMAIKQGYLISMEKDENIPDDYKKESNNQIKVKNISKSPLILDDIIMESGTYIYINKELIDSPIIKKAFSLNVLVIIEEISKKNIKKALTKKEETEEKSENKGLTTTPSSWEPHAGKMLDKKGARYKVFGNNQVEEIDETNWVDEEEEEKDTEELVVTKIDSKKNLDAKKEVSKKKTTKKTISKKTKGLKPVGKIKAEPITDGISSSGKFTIPSESNMVSDNDDLIFELDSQGNIQDKSKNKEISFVDKEQDQIRAKSHPKLNNQEID